METRTVNSLPLAAYHDGAVRCLLAIELSKKSWIVAVNTPGIKIRRRSAVRGAASRPKSTSAPTPKGTRPRHFYEPTHLKRINGWQHRKEATRIDFIFKHLRSSLRINEMRLIFNGHFYPIVSDHFGCLARFHLHPI